MHLADTICLTKYKVNKLELKKRLLFKFNIDIFHIFVLKILSYNISNNLHKFLYT